MTDDFEKLFQITQDMLLDDLKDFVREHMVSCGWAEVVDGTYVLTGAGRNQLEEVNKE